VLRAELELGRGAAVPQAGRARPARLPPPLRNYRECRRSDLAPAVLSMEVEAQGGTCASKRS